MGENMATAQAVKTVTDVEDYDGRLFFDDVVLTAQGVGVVVERVEAADGVIVEVEVDGVRSLGLEDDFALLDGWKRTRIIDGKAVRNFAPAINDEDDDDDDEALFHADAVEDAPTSGQDVTDAEGLIWNVADDGHITLKSETVAGGADAPIWPK